MRLLLALLCGPGRPGRDRVTEPLPVNPLTAIEHASPSGLT